MGNDGLVSKRKSWGLEYEYHMAKPGKCVFCEKVVVEGTRDITGVFTVHTECLEAYNTALVDGENNGESVRSS